MNVVAQSHQSFAQGQRRLPRLGAPSLNGQLREALRDVVVQFTSQPGPLFFLGVEQARAKFTRVLLGLLSLVMSRTQPTKCAGQSADFADGQINRERRTVLAPAR
jgi:hypothetical protein